MMEEDECEYMNPSHPLDIMPSARQGIASIFPGSSNYLLDLISLTAESTLDAAGIMRKPGRNPDFEEICYGEFRFASAYGFRNIQNVVRKLGRGGMDFQLIDVMACASSCINGGAQLPLSGSRDVKSAKLSEVREKLSEQERPNTSNIPFLKGFLENWLHGNLEMLHTEYHNVKDTSFELPAQVSGW